MKCKKCEYPLWNLTARQCPECGSPFAPSDFDLVPGAVKFLCPHCAQPYYGTSALGHLEPDAFDCLKCNTAISMDDMVVQPADGVDEMNTVAWANPWLRMGQSSGPSFFGALFHTIGASMGSPSRLILATPPGSSCGRAICFYVLTSIVPLPLGIAPVILVMGLGGGPSVAYFSGVCLSVIVLSAVLACIRLVAWWLVTHGMLRLLGTGSLHSDFSMRRSFQVICYSSGSNILLGIPCIGPYLGVLPVLWQMITAILMFMAAYRTSAIRSILSVLALPLLICALVAGLVMWPMYAASSAQPSATNRPARVVNHVHSGIVAHARATPGPLNEHILVLAQSSHIFETFELDPEFVTPRGVPGSSVSLHDLSRLQNPTQFKQVAALAQASLPKNVIAHRCGAWVFPYHGLDIRTCDGGLWLAVLDQPRSVANGEIFVGLADGSHQVLTFGQLPAALRRQNALRAKEGLAPLPRLSDITVESPATGIGSTNVRLIDMLVYDRRATFLMS